MTRRRKEKRQEEKGTIRNRKLKEENEVQKEQGMWNAKRKDNKEEEEDQEEE